MKFFTDQFPILGISIWDWPKYSSKIIGQLRIIVLVCRKTTFSSERLIFLTSFYNQWGPLSIKA